MTRYFLDHGSSALQAQQQATGWSSQQVQQQATFLAYVDAFWALMLVALSVVSLALLLRNVKLGTAPMGH